MSLPTFVQLRGGMEINGETVAPDSRIGLLVAFLCSMPGHQSSRTELCDTIWPEKDRELQLLSLRQTLFQAQKLVSIDSNRHSLRLIGVETDLAVEDIHTTEVVLKSWNHPWVKRWQDQDIKSIVTAGVKLLKSVEAPFQKVEILVRIREFVPFDQHFISQLSEQYQALGWDSQIAKLYEEIEGAKAKFALADESPNPSRAITAKISATELKQVQLSNLQRLELALALAPLHLAQGTLREGFDMVVSARRGVDVPLETELRVRYILSRLAYAEGDRALTYSQGNGLNPQTRNGMECYVLGMAALSKNRFEACIRWAKRGLRDLSNSPDLGSALCSLLASTLSYVQRQSEGLTYCGLGVELARQSGNTYHEVAIRASETFCRRAVDKAYDIEPELVALIKLCRSEGFSIREAHLLGILGQHYQLKGDLRLAQDVLEKSILVAESVKNEETKAMALDYLGEVLVKAGKYHEAVLTFQQSTLIRRQFGDRLGVATSYRGAGRGLLLLEEFDFAVKMFDRALGAYRSLEHEILEGGCWLYKGLALVGSGKIAAAREAFENARGLLIGKSEDVVLHATDPDLHPIVQVVMGHRDLDAVGLSGLFCRT